MPPISPSRNAADRQALAPSAAEASAPVGSGSGALSRRELLAAGLAAGVLTSAGCATTARAHGGHGAGDGALSQGVPQGGGFYRTTLGSVELTFVADGNLRLGTVHPVWGREAPEAAVQNEARRGGARPDQPVLAQCNTLVIKAEDELILVDTGCRDAFGPQAGAMPRHLEAAGIDPSEITKVVITHAHPDHVNGLDDGSGHELFENARYVTSAEEQRFWTAATVADLQGINSSDEGRQGVIATARRALGLMAPRLDSVGDGQEIATGVRAMLLPGHTPGHLGVTISSGEHTLHYVGDALTHPVISFRRPEWSFSFDAFPDEAHRTRRRLLGHLASTDGRELVAAAHIGFPGLGTVTRDGSAFNYHAAPWDWQLG